jgi:uncharacterized protein YutE (UPF0331/DUF86 family)
VNSIDLKREVLEQVVPQLEAEGYTVYLEPTRQLLPSFMTGYVPDAIAFRSDKKLAIEVLVEGDRSATKEPGLKQRFEGEKDWELRVLYARPTSPRNELPVMDDQAIDASIASAESLISTKQLGAALLIAWATFEALGRALSPKEFARPQTPLRLVEVLAADGSLTPPEADLLRGLATTRNQFIHGGLDKRVDLAELQKFIDILKTLRRMKITAG